MSRDNEGNPAPMSDRRRETIISEVCRAMGADAPFPGEQISVTIVRRDGAFTELVMHEVFEGPSAGCGE